MAIEEKEAQETLLKELIEKVEKDPIPTHIFTTEDTDPLVLLGKLNEIIAKLKDLRALYISSDVKATQALDNAINALANATQALQSANTALSTANTAIDTANTALETANTAIDISNDAVDTATTLGYQANNKADNAINQANEALRVAQEALNQIVEGLGSKVYDISGNLLTSAKFKGDNGINVDMSEDDPETFDIRLDDTITKAIEDNNTLAQNNKSSIESITEDIAGIKQAQASDSLAIVGLQSKNLSQDEEIADLQSVVTANSQKLQRALLLPVSTPSEQKLVGIDTDNTQDLIGLDTNLKIESNKLQARIKPDYETGWFFVNKNTNYVFAHNLHTLNFIVLIDIVYDNGTHYFYHQNTLINPDGTANSYAGGIEEGSRTSTEIFLTSAKNYAFTQSRAVNEVGTPYADFATNENVQAKVRLFKLGGDYQLWK